MSYEHEFTYDQLLNPRLTKDSDTMIKGVTCAGGYHQELWDVGQALSDELELWLETHNVVYEYDPFNNVLTIDDDTKAMMFKLVWI